MFGVSVTIALGFIRDAIAEDSALRAWAIAQYGADTQITTQIGFNLADPPAADTGPVIFLVPSPYGTGARELLAESKIILAIGWIINDPRIVETAATATTGPTKTYSGVAAAIEFGDMIMQAIYARHTEVFRVDEAHVAVEDMPSWPMIQGAARVELSLVGGSPGGPG